jgi:uncharacterized oligopeptide transporter (OPT) family protein
MSNLLFVFAIICAVCGVVSSIVITSWLSKRGIKINYPFIKVMIIKYVHQYRKITQQETGKPGPWFFSFVISMNLALVFAVVGFVLKAI